MAFVGNLNLLMKAFLDMFRDLDEDSPIMFNVFLEDQAAMHI